MFRAPTKRLFKNAIGRHPRDFARQVAMVRNFAIYARDTNLNTQLNMLYNYDYKHYNQRQS